MKLTTITFTNYCENDFHEHEIKNKKRLNILMLTESFKNIKCDEIKIKLGINREKVQLYFISMNSPIIILK